MTPCTDTRHAGAIRWFFLCAAAFAACGDGGAPAATTTERVTACRYDFTADVRSGPSTPLHLEGRLDLVTRFGRHLEGRLVPATGAEIPVTGQLTPDGMRVMLHFDLPNGRSIDGVGPVPGGMWSCRGPLEGDLRGPAAGDSGDWITNINPTTVNACATACTLRPRTRQECANYCTVTNNFQTTGAVYNQCLTDCNAGGNTLTYQVLACQTSGALTSFFGTGCGI